MKFKIKWANPPYANAVEDAVVTEAIRAVLALEFEDVDKLMEHLQAVRAKAMPRVKGAGKLSHEYQLKQACGLMWAMQGFEKHLRIGYNLDRLPATATIILDGEINEKEGEASGLMNLSEHLIAVNSLATLFYNYTSADIKLLRARSSDFDYVWGEYAVGHKGSMFSLFWDLFHGKFNPETKEMLLAYAIEQHGAYVRRQQEMNDMVRKARQQMQQGEEGQPNG